MKLHDYQGDIVERVVRLFTPAPGSRRQVFRAQVHLAPGTGKTRISAAVAERVAATAPVLIAVPTKELLRQTVRAWRAAGRTGPVIAVCSERDADFLREPGLRVTTQALDLARWTAEHLDRGETDITVLTCYASVPVIAAAHRLRHATVPSQPRWALLVTDEAHHTAGVSSWGRINDQHFVPADRRLALTATPRIMGKVRRDRGGRVLPSIPVRSMDDPAVFGLVAASMGLGEAQRRGLLARCRVVAAEVDDPNLRRLAAKWGYDDPRVQAAISAAAGEAMLRTAHEYGARRILSYHRENARAAAFAAPLPAIGHTRAADDEPMPARVYATSLDQNSPAAQRTAVLNALRAGTDPQGAPMDAVVVASVRLLTEGIDVPAVDAVAIIDARGSEVELVQIIGRAVRLDPDDPEKVATIIVPVIHLTAPAGEPMVGPAWDGLTNVLTALAAHDDELAGAVTITPSTHPNVDRDVRIQRREEAIAQLAAMVHLTRKRARRSVLDHIRLTVVRGGDEELDRVIAAAARFADERGHLRVPTRSYIYDGIDLGRQLDVVRRQYRRDEIDAAVAAGGHSPTPDTDDDPDSLPQAVVGHRLPSWAVDELETLGIVWRPQRTEKELRLAAARAYGQQYLHLLPPEKATVELDGARVPVGVMLRRCRRTEWINTHPEEAAELDALAQELRTQWRVPADASWDATWHRWLALATRYMADGGHRAELVAQGGREYGGEDLGGWLTAQHARWHELTDAQRQALTNIRLKPAAAIPEARKPAAPLRSQSQRFDDLITAAQRHLDDVGPLVNEIGENRVTEDYRVLIDGTEVKLRQRLKTARSRSAGFSPGQLARLADLGLPWAERAADASERGPA